MPTWGLVLYAGEKIEGKIRQAFWGANVKAESRKIEWACKALGIRQGPYGV